MKKIIFAICTLFLLITVQGAEVGSMGIKIDKTTIISSLKILHAQGKISDADYKKAVAELKQMSDKQLGSLVKKGADLMKKMPPTNP